MASKFKFAKNTIYNGQMIKAGTVKPLLDGVAVDLERRGIGSIVPDTPGTELESTHDSATEESSKNTVSQSTATAAAGKSKTAKAGKKSK